MSRPPDTETLHRGRIDDMDAAAAFSACGRYRYALWRRWGDGPSVLFVMLNPSTASATANDPTIRRCIGFARRWGFGGLAVGNLFAWRTPSPDKQRRARSPVGPDNDAWLARLQDEADLTVAAWGHHGALRQRDDAVRDRLIEPHVLGLTRRHAPRHPLYMRADTRPLPWAEALAASP